MMEKIIGTVPGKCRNKQEKARLPLKNNPETSWYMKIQEAKDIRLVDFLAGFGYEPVIQRGNSVWYKSPFRAEKKASFKVDLHKELWYDFGLAMRVLIISFQCITCIAY